MEPHDSNPLPATGLAGRVALWVASAFGIGLVTPWPATVGSLLGIPLAAAISEVSPVGAQAGVILLLVVVAAPICTAAERTLGGEHDPQSILLDEIIALPIVFIGVGPASWRLLAAGFLLFRLCDVFKPGLARSAENLPGGWGDLGDDCTSAILACILLHIAIDLDQWLQWGWLAA